MESYVEIEKIPIKRPAPVVVTPKVEEKKPEEAAKEGEAKAEEPKKEGEEAEKKAEEPAAEVPVAETVQEYESKERTRSVHGSVNFDISSHAIPPQQKQQLIKVE